MRNSSQKSGKISNFPDNTSQELIRLNRFIALSGICSRRQADELIKKGLIAVNGEVVKELGVKVPLSAIVTYKNIRVFPEKPFYFLFYKPRGVKSIIHSSKNKKKSILDYLPFNPTPNTTILLPLNRTCEGLSIITNDGIVIHKINSRRKTISQIFEVGVAGIIKSNIIESLRKGIKTSNLNFQPKDVFWLEKSGNKKVIGIEITYPSSKYILKVLKLLEVPYIYVKRTWIGELSLGDMKVGQIKKVDKKKLLFL